MKILSVRLDRDSLLALPDLERSFFLALGHVANEINAITKMLYWAAGTPAPTDAEEHGRFAMMLLLIRLLAGKLKESWEMLHKNFFGAALSKRYDPMLTGDPAAAMRSLKRYFDSANAADEIRNRFAFHYSPADLGAVLPQATDPLLVYMDRVSAPNNLFHMCEQLLGEALLDSLRPIAGPRSFEALVGELFEVSLWFAQVSDGLMDAIIDDHGQELRAADPEEVHFSGLRDFRDVTIPWFTDTTGVVKATSGSA